VITDRELDAQLAGVAGISDADLPPLPEEFLASLMVTEAESATILAARQLVSDAHEARATSRRRRPSRRALLRAGAAVLAVAAAWTTAVLVTPSERTPAPHDRIATPSEDTTAPTGATPTHGVRLVAAEEAVFPLSLDPAPPGLTPEFSLWGGVPYYGDGPLIYAADYMNPDGDRVLVTLFTEDPRQLDGWGPEGAPAGTVSVNGRTVEAWTSEFSVSLVWERPDGSWLRLSGEHAYNDLPAMVAVAESVVDRPQPLGLQFGLAPAGYSLGGYEESRSIDLVNDAAPMEAPLRLSVIQGQQSGLTVDDMVEGLTLAAPVQAVTIQGRDGRLALVNGDEGTPPYWYVVGQFADGALFLLIAPETVPQEDLLQIAEQATYRA
jgi:hypothetical protein